MLKEMLSPKSLISFLDDLGMECQLSIQTGDMPYFNKRIEHFIADGVFNGEPSGLFKCETPYEGPSDNRTLLMFLEQEPYHTWPGSHKLLNLVADELQEMMKAWVLKRCEDSGYQVAWSQIESDWDETMYRYRIHPHAMDDVLSEWYDFLQQPMTLMESWRFEAKRLAKDRRMVIAHHHVSQDIQNTMTNLVDEWMCQQQVQDSPMMALSKFILVYNRDAMTHVKAYIGSEVFRRRFPNYVQIAKERYGSL